MVKQYNTTTAYRPQLSPVTFFTTVTVKPVSKKKNNKKKCPHRLQKFGLTKTVAFGGRFQFLLNIRPVGSLPVHGPLRQSFAAVVFEDRYTLSPPILKMNTFHIS